MLNQILHERYQLKSLLGCKTGRRTFLAQDLVTQENVVVKLMLFNVDFVWDDLKLFKREVEVLKSRDFNFNLTLVSYFICFFFCALTFVSSGDFFLYRACLFVTVLLITASCATTKLTIDRREISRSCSIFGWRFWFANILPRTSNIQIELTKLFYKASPHGLVSVSPRINIWAGTLKIELGGDEYLSPSELEWLATELRNWLHLPISK